MVGIAFELDRPAHSMLQDRAGCVAFLYDCSGHVACRAGDFTRHRLDARHDLLGRLGWAAPAEAGERR